MKCAYESVLGNRSVERFCNYYGGEFLKYVDASLAVRMHEIFGFGSAKRLPEMFNEMNPRLNDQMQTLVEEEGEDLWYTARNTHWVTDWKIKEATGWSPCAVAEEMPVLDDWKPQMHTRKEVKQHEIRKEYIGTMEIKLGLYWHMVLDYCMVKHGFGAERLDRLYRALRTDYNAFAGEFLKGTKAAEKNMTRMIADMQDKVRKLGIEFDYGDSGNVKIKKEA